MSAAFVGFDPDEVEKLVIQLRGAAEDIANLARQADQALDRARTFLPPGPSVLEVDIGRLRGCGTTIGEMSADVHRRLTKFRAEQRFQETQQWGGTVTRRRLRGNGADPRSGQALAAGTLGPGAMDPRPAGH